MLRKGIDAWRLVPEIERRLIEREIPTCGGEAGLRADPAPQWENTRDEWQFANTHAIDEVLATPIEFVLDFKHIIAAGWDFVKHNGVGVELIIAGKSHFLALRIVNRNRGFKPAGHGVGNKGDQLPWRQLSFLLSDRRADSFAREIDGGGVEILSADCRLKRRALPPASGINITDMGIALGQGVQSDRQP